MPEIPLKKKIQLLYWITLIRAGLALTLGFAVIFIFLPGEQVPILVNFMGIFWLVNGIIILRWGIRREEKRIIPILAGIVGILTGSLVLIGWPFPRALGMFILGSVILMTGLLRVMGGFTMEEKESLQKPKSNISLGFFEIVLGLLLMYIRAKYDFRLYLVAGLWALFGGIALFNDAMKLRKQLREQDIRQQEIDNIDAGSDLIPGNE
ncbi:HdeD family acid-resistance protein [Methanosarcina mazei]|jgi:uncharacterized membrane protein HdeD (DUF308 family)|uniref:DUF308 domain-containing protein n=2 Tax=Methanosarcina mazei TaxID=2209 RepID=A0A0E3RLU3_METMZ|nr:DUF308 domain-containing protein [Methanosarcina mazei]AAM31585.1 conserved protein [Methanosarcina mazei Go1]AKB65993.1 hypothetical protein MSMAS_2797 [Methanosarcina mazei S-6]WIM41878.1 hypothetical protein PSF70_09970 [Methanosarcina mazei]WIM45328.1 hypothetical protein PQQ20_09905 [Methanosarcina mazei]